MPGIRALVRLAAGGLALLAYVWVAAVRATPRVKRRKQARRARRRR